MHRLVLSVLAVLALAGAPRCEAQSQVGLPMLVLEIRPAVLAPAAFVRPYGRLLATEFAEVVRDSANADCLKTKGIERTALAERTNRILLRQATQMFELLDGTIDRAAFDARLRELAGPNVEAEWARVRNDPDVKAFLALHRSLRLAVAADVTIEKLDMAAVILRIKLVRSISPLATGKMELYNANPRDEYLGKLHELVSKSKSAALGRHIELAEAAEKALENTFKRDSFLKLGPVQLMPGLDRELADVCVCRSNPVRVKKNLGEEHMIHRPGVITRRRFVQTTAAGSVALAGTGFGPASRAQATKPGQLALRDRIFEVSLAEISKGSDGIWWINIETKAKVYDEENWAPNLYHQGFRLNAVRAADL